MVSMGHGPSLIQRYREALRVRHAPSEVLEQWLRRFLRFHRLRHRREMGEPG